MSSHVTMLPDGTMPAADEQRLLSLRHKGLLALLAVVGLIALMGALVMAYRSSTEADVEALARLAAPQQGEIAGTGVSMRVAQVRERGRAVAVTLAISAGLGVVLIGVVVVLFFARLSSDIEALRSDALEIERRSAFHREKMAAIGSLAAGVLNDIGNPIAAIDGYARAMKEAHAAGDCNQGQGICDPDLILHETTRLQVITRQIAELAAELPSQPRWLSLNDIVRTTLLLMHFDPRLAGVRVETKLDPQLPAIPGVADRLLQMVMALTVHAADAALAAAGGVRGRALITIKTCHDQDQVELSVADNGAGMNDALIRDAFERPDPPQADAPGAVLGLAACRAIVVQHGGRVRLSGDADAAEPGAGVQVRLPVQPAPAIASALL